MNGSDSWKFTKAIEKALMRYAKITKCLKSPKTIHCQMLLPTAKSLPKWIFIIHLKEKLFYSVVKSGKQLLMSDISLMFNFPVAAILAWSSSVNKIIKKINDGKNIITLHPEIKHQRKIVNVDKSELFMTFFIDADDFHWIIQFQHTRLEAVL